MNHLLPPEPPAEQGRSALGVVVLAGVLVVSLLLNLLIGIAYVDEKQRSTDLRERGARPSAAPSTDGRSLDEIIAAVEQLRGLTFTEPVEPTILDTSALQARVAESFGEEFPGGELIAIQRTLITLGVIPPDTDLLATYQRTYEEQVAGFYDDESGELVVLGEDVADPSPFTQIILAHELTHAVTDQRFGLDELGQLQDADDDDAAAAFLALVEGDATLLMGEFTGVFLSAEERAAAVVEQQSLSMESLEALPAFLRESLTFPYREGLTFVQALHERGGYARVDRAYEDPPTSTEQILHPERYFDRDEPRSVRLPRVVEALGEGWRRLTTGTVGELDLRLIADHPSQSGGLSQIASRVAAAGWDGGTFASFANGPRTLVVMSTVWDSDDEAIEATDEFGRWLPLRYGNRGTTLDVGAGDGSGFESDDGAGMVLRSGDRMIIVLGPDPASVRAARAAFDGF